MAQGSSEKFSSVKACWERLHLQNKCSAKVKDPSQKADVLRLLMLQTKWAHAEKLLDAQAASNLFLKYAGSYSEVVDSPDPNEGLNNYAESALTLLEGKPNESKMWTSSLKDKFKSMKYVEEAFLHLKATRAMLYPEDKQDFPMKLTKPEIMPTKREIQVLVMNDENRPPKPEVMSSSGDKPFSFVSIEQSTNKNSGANVGANQSSTVTKGCSSPQMSNFTSNQGQSLHNRKPGLLVDPSRKETSRKPWNSSAGPSSSPTWSNGQSENIGGQFRRTNGQQDNFGDHSNGCSGQARGFDGSGQTPRNGASEFRDSGVQNQQKGLFSSVRQNTENFSRGPQDFSNEDIEDSVTPAGGFFRSAREQLVIDNQKKYGRDKSGSLSSSSYGNTKRSLGTRRGPSTKFVPPVMNREDTDDGGTLVRRAGPSGKSSTHEGEEEFVDERLKNIDPKMIELITNEIMDHGAPIRWDDIAGLDFAKNTIKEIVVWPMLRPDIFTGLRGPPKGLLLFGPPGTGKTLIGKCIASQSKSTFFSISASSLTSKWVGEGEKMVRALFAVARVHQPAVIFLDEIDSLLSQRSDGEHEASRRIKTEFLVQLDGATTSSDERILCVGATNRPQEIDEAARRRFVKRLYIPLPESSARRQIVINLLQDQSNTVNDSDLETICQNTDGYSGADMANLCREAALGPIRSINFCDIENITADQVRPITASDFMDALKNVRPSVSSKDLIVYLDWNKQYGTWDI